MARKLKAGWYVTVDARVYDGPHDTEEEARDLVPLVQVENPHADVRVEAVLR